LASVDIELAAPGENRAAAIERFTDPNIRRKS
jgi:hypothetical protein